MFKPSKKTKDGFQVCCIPCAEKKRVAAKERYESNAEHRKEKIESQLAKYHGDIEYRTRRNRDATKYQTEKYRRDPEYKKKKNSVTAKGQLKRYHRDPRQKVHVNISSQIRSSLKNGKEGASWESMVGFSLNELMRHLESQFLKGMSWDNYGEWHIDHRTPKSWFDFDASDDEQFRACWRLGNLKPMWGEDNISKSNRYSD